MTKTVMNADERKARKEISYQIRLTALALNRLATEIMRPVREQPFEVMIDTDGIMEVEIVTPRNKSE